MADNDVNLSIRESRQIEQYAVEQGIRPEQAIANLYRANIADRLAFKRQPGELRDFPVTQKK